MLPIETLKSAALEAGFTHAAPLDAATVILRDEVRAMCNANSCGMYDRNWSCPPACGELEELRQKVARYRGGILVQTVGELEDAFDAEGLMEAQESFKESFTALHEKLLADYPDMLPLCAGTCTRCKRCTYPDEPCRFPDKRFSSMEAYGMVVSDTCKANDLPYYYGPNTIAYTGCFLLE